jgi:hypothetical protein
MFPVRGPSASMRLACERRHRSLRRFKHDLGETTVVCRIEGKLGLPATAFQLMEAVRPACVGTPFRRFAPKRFLRRAITPPILPVFPMAPAKRTTEQMPTPYHAGQFHQERRSPVSGRIAWARHA